MPTDFIDEQKITFDNFDELKGYLKGKTIYSPTIENFNKVKDVLGLLGFEHEARWVPCREDQDRVIEVENTSFMADFATNYEEYDVDGDELLEDYYILKEALVYAIMPWPITIAEARQMDNLRLSRMQALATTMLRAANTLQSEEVEWLLGKHALENAEQLLENMEIQRPNLKFIW